MYCLTCMSDTSVFDCLYCVINHLGMACEQLVHLVLWTNPIHQHITTWTTRQGWIPKKAHECKSGSVQWIICCALADCITILILLCVNKYAQGGETMHTNRDNAIMITQSYLHMQVLQYGMNYLTDAIMNMWSWIVWSNHPKIGHQAIGS